MYRVLGKKSEKEELKKKISLFLNQLKDNPISGFVILFMVILMGCAFLLIGENERAAEGAVNWAYSFLVIGVIIGLVGREKKMIRTSQRFHKEILIFLFFIILTAVWTHPLIFKMHTSILGDPEWTFDSLGGLRGVWRAKYAWLNKLPSDVDSLIAHPFGGYVLRVDPQPLLHFPLLILSFWEDEVFASNIYVLANYVLSAIMMYCLVYSFTRNRISSAVAGLIYSFAPYLSLKSFAHAGMATLQWMPLYILFLFKLDEDKSYKSAIYCALSFSLVSLSVLYYGYFMVVFTAGFILFKIVFRQICRQKVESKSQRVSSGKYFKVLIVGACIVLITILPFTYSIIKATLSLSESAEAVSPGHVPPLKDLYRYSARVSDYFAPSEYHPIFGKVDFWFMKPYTEASRHWAERTLYLGIIPLFLTAYGVAGWWKRKKREMTGKKEDFIIPFFIFSASLAFIFSLAPTIEVFGSPIPMPSFFMYKIAPMFRCVCRFGAVVILCVSVLAGFGIKELLRRLQSKAKQMAVTCFVVCFIVFEFIVIPPFRNVDLSKTPSVYEWVASQSGDVVIAEYPWLGSIQEGHYKYLFYQRVHQKKMVNGARRGTFGDAVRREAIKIRNQETASILSYLGAKYVIVHKSVYNPQNIKKIDANPGLRFFRDFPSAVVYEVVAEKPDLVKVFWKSFAMWERWDDGSAWRWAGNNATIWLCNTRQENIQIDFEFTVLSFYKERTLEIFLNDRLIKSVKISAPSDLSSARRVSLGNLELESGENIIRFFTPQGTDKIDDILHNGDQRRVSFAFSSFNIGLN